MKVRWLIGALAVVACSPVADAGEPAPSRRGAEAASEAEVARSTEEFRALRDRFLAGYYESRPVRATELGIHDHDHRLPALERAEVHGWIDRLLGWDAELEQIPLSRLEGEDRFDHGVMEYALRAELLEAEEVRSWARDPRLYTATIASGIGSVAERAYAPLADRVAALGSRMEAALALLEAARANVSAPPALWTELAVEETEGLIRFLETGLEPMLAAQSAAGDDPMPAELEAARDRLVVALQDHGEWLRSDLMPRSTGDFRLGRYLFERKLLYEEHIGLGVEELDRLNERAIEEYRQWIARVAAEIDPDRTPREIMDSITHEHPEPEELLDTARGMMESVRAWVARSGVVPLLTEELPVVRETPPYARSGFASMDAPGPFETGSRRAFYNITNVLPEWTEEQKQEHLTYFNYPGLLGVTIHETFPGHYVQWSYEREVPSELRRVFTTRSFVEGWAHYAEQMVLDAGYSDGDPVVRLGQLRRALQRHARWYAGLHLHAMGAPLDEVVERFMEIAYFEEFPARREVIRATYDPTYLYYALGRMQILELRADYEAWLEEEERAFVLSEFHERLLRLALPLPLVREALMPLPERERERARIIRRR